MSSWLLRPPTRSTDVTEIGGRQIVISRGARQMRVCAALTVLQITAYRRPFCG